MSKKKIAATLKFKRNDAGKSVREVVETLRSHGIDVSEKTVYGWESGHRQPDSDILLLLCNIYGIKSFDEFEQGEQEYFGENNSFKTIAAHFNGKSISEEKLKRIEKFIEFTLKEDDN